MNITDICGSITGVIKVFEPFLGQNKGIKNELETKMPFLTHF